MNRNPKKCRLMAMTAIMMAGVLVPTACTKEDAVESSEWSGKGLLLKAEKSQGHTKTVVDGVEVYWSSSDKLLLTSGTGSFAAMDVEVSGGDMGDQVAVVNTSLRGQLLALYVPTSQGYEYSENVVTVRMPSSYEYSEEGGLQCVDFPMVGSIYLASDADGAVLPLKHLCAAVNVVVTNNTLSDLVFDKVVLSSSQSQICGAMSIDVSDVENHLAVDPVDGTDANRTITMNFNNVPVTLAPGASKKVQIPVYPMAAGSTLDIVIHSHNVYIPGVPQSADLGIRYSNTASFTRPLARNTVISPTVNMTVANGHVEAAAVFSVSADKKVYFSQGNLQYDKASTATTKWQFAPYQYTVIGKENTASGNNVLDLFAFGTSGNLYGPESAGYTSRSIVGSLTGATGAENDWGWHNSIRCGETVIPNHTWRTLSEDEWEYLLRSRSTSVTIAGVSNARHVSCSVHGEAGIILLPDNYVEPEDMEVSHADWLHTHVNTESDGSTEVSYNEISDADWEKLEAAGCIFLPEGWIYYPAKNGYESGREAGYWSSTDGSTTSIPQKNERAIHVYMNKCGLSTRQIRGEAKYGIWAKKKENRMSVRLVRDAF